MSNFNSLLAAIAKLPSQTGELPLPASPSVASATQSNGEIIDRVLSEYCRRAASGEPIDPDQFCQDHPEVQSSLRRLLALHLLCEAQPELFDPPADALWPQPGEMFLGLHLQRQLGRGAFARVYLAHEEDLGGRRVAVKIAHRGGSEARMLGRLEHPSVVPVHSIKSDPKTGLTAVCMPYLGAATLHNLLDQLARARELPRKATAILDAARSTEAGNTPAPADSLLQRVSYVEGVAHLGAQLAQALDYVHEQGILHLDLKPSNVLLTPSGRPMLLDFNLSADHQSSRPPLGGTIPYMSPEQLRLLKLSKGEELQPLDGRSDLFSLGVMLYELLARRHPFGPLSLKKPETELASELAERHLQGATPLHLLNPRVSKKLSRLIHQCLELRPEDRPTSARVVAEELTQLRLRRARWPQFMAASFLIVGLTFASVLSSMASPDELAQREYDRGMAAYQRKNYPQAAQHLEKVLKNAPHFPGVRLPLARSLDKAGKLGAAREHYEAACAEQNSGVARACLAYCLARWDNPEAAIALYQQALEAGFTKPVVYNNLALACMRSPRGLGDVEPGARLALAEQYLNEAIRLDPTFRPAYANRLLLEEQKARLDPSYLPLQGLADADKWIANQGGSPWEHRQAAVLYALTVQRIHSQGRAALGSWALVAAHTMTLEDQRRHLGQAALGSWAAVLATRSHQPGQLLENLCHPDLLRVRANHHLREAWQGGIEPRVLLEDPLLANLLAHENPRWMDVLPERRAPAPTIHHYDPIDGL